MNEYELKNKQKVVAFATQIKKVVAVGTAAEKDGFSICLYIRSHI